MKISGKMHIITNVSAFATSYMQNNNAPTPGTFMPAPSLRIHLGSVSKGFMGGFFPSVSVKTNTAADGSFSFNLTSSQLKLIEQSQGCYLLAYKKTGSVKVLNTTVDVYEPVYRSAIFEVKTTTKDKTGLKLYYAPYRLEDAMGISQAMVNEQIAESKKDFKDIEKLSATIQNGKISVSGSGRGADIKFKIDLGVSTSSNLSAYIKGSVEDLDIDLPGPDFLVGICVSKDDIAKQVDKGIAGIMKEANKTVEKEINKALAEVTGMSEAIIAAAVKSMASVTFSSLRYPITNTKTIKFPGGSFKVNEHSIVPNVSVGIPRVIS